MREQQTKQVYKTALYLRLSKDDEGAGESSSITTQRSILQEYADKHGLVVVDEYSDDGFSGTNYDRPEFKRMISDIENGKINCVLTKDLSRLGRNSARTTDLLDEYFPAHRVRYISVIDGYDSFNLTSGTSMTASFMTIMNEMYARDISNKIRTAFNAKMERGECIASFAPYGYKKDVENGNKNRLVIDYQVAHIVKELFQMAADGKAPSEIAKYLNNKGVATPAMYHCLSLPYLNVDNYTQRKEWTSAMICKMLKNEVYLGKTLQGKTNKISFKSKVTQARPRSEWIVIENTHEPLITEEIFNIVRNRSVSRRCLPTKGFTNVFAGIAKCADCGRNMSLAPSRKKGTTYNLCCGGYKTYDSTECSNHFISYDLLYDAVLQELQGWLALSKDDKIKIVNELQQEKTQQTENIGASQAIANMKKRVDELSFLMKKLFENHTFNRINETMYEKLTVEYSNELTDLEKAIEDISGSVKSEQDRKERYNDFFSLLEEVTEVKELTKPLLQKLIERIEIEQGEYYKDENGKRLKRQTVRIYYRFIGCVGEQEKTP